MIIYNNYITIGIVAGEASGDILGAGLISSLKKYLTRVRFVGIGGPLMKLENMESWYDIQELSVMGIVEIISKLPRLLNIRKDLIKRFYHLNIDIFIGIDYPDFNIEIEKTLKKNGIRTIHYVSPTVWAWRANRIFDLKKAVDKVLVIFPFEKKIYDHFNIPCQFIGHTLADKIPIYPDKIYMRKKLGISKNTYCLALLPGSRTNEIKMLAYDFLTCSKLLLYYFPNLEILVPMVHRESVLQFTKMAEKLVKLRIFNNYKPWEIMMASDVSLLSAGTATLECMLAKCPMVVAYRMNTITFNLVKYLISTPWISYPNILSGTDLVREFIQKECNPKNLLKILLELINNHNNQSTILQEKFIQLHQIIKRNADEQAAQVVLQIIHKLH